MRITKTAEQADEEKQIRQRYKDIYMICPRCGEKRLYWDYLKDSKHYDSPFGIEMGPCYSKSVGFFKLKTLTIHCYSCHTCGTEWEDDGELSE